MYQRHRKVHNGFQSKRARLDRMVFFAAMFFGVVGQFLPVGGAS